jgi:hypothetical protein
MLDKPAVKHLAEVCINNRHHPDWHYDIVALPRSSSISEVALAELECAKQRRSWY